MKENILEYKGYFSKIQYSAEDNVLHGKIEGVADLVTFESSNCDEIEMEFRNAVDDYLEFCKEIGKSPDKPYKGSFNIRISPELHKRADITAQKKGFTLNQLVTNAISEYLDGTQNKTIIYCPHLAEQWKVDNPAEKYTGKTEQINTDGVYVTWLTQTYQN